jgi:hypothetical protein
MTNKQNDFILHHFCICRECASKGNNVFVGSIKKELSNVLEIGTFINSDEVKRL